MGFVLMASAGISTGDGRVKDRPNGQNIFIITLDGFRWQELFYGADSTLLKSAGRRSLPKESPFWGASSEERRQKLMPFVWSILVEKGQLYGDRYKGSAVNIQNFFALSYPGYNEIFTGATDAYVSTNEKLPNRNRNVLEFLNAAPGYEGRVASFASWDAFPFILNEARSGLPVNSGFQELKSRHLTRTGRAINAVLKNPVFSRGSVRNDLLTALAAKEYILAHLPKVVHIGLGGTDEAAHDGDYDRYLEEAHRADEIIAEFWKMVQAHPYYRGNTTFLITTDHGRGAGTHSWKGHGIGIPGSYDTWLLLLGKGVQPLEAGGAPGQLYQKQVAGTVSYLLGFPSYGAKTLPLHLFRNE